MRLFDYDPYNGRERMQRAAPKFLEEVAEPQVIWSVAGEEHDSMRAGITGATNAALIPWTNENDIAGWENFLGITYADPATLRMRQACVAACIIGLRHFGRPEIATIFHLFVDGEIYVRLIGGTIDINVTIDSDMGIWGADAYAALQKKKPAHLGLHQTLTYRRKALMIQGYAHSFSSIPKRENDLTINADRDILLRSAIAAKLSTIPLVTAAPAHEHRSVVLGLHTATGLTSQRLRVTAPIQVSRTAQRTVKHGSTLSRIPIRTTQHTPERTAHITGRFFVGACSSIPLRTNIL